MSQRLDYVKTSPGASRALYAMEQYLETCGLERKLLDLVRLRTSQINGCAFCLDMHWKDLRAAGESEQRLYALDAWRESPGYSEREQAALAWAEAVTLVASSRVPDEVYEQARRQFSEKELVDLTLAVAAINAWNRMSISFRKDAGAYQPNKAQQSMKKGA